MEITDKEIIATIFIKDNGFTANCDYESIKRLAKEKAKEIGGNALVITEHIEPDFTSTCHRLRAKVVKLKDPEKYEKNISWHAKRPLKIKNFRGGIKNRPFQAATYSGIMYYIVLDQVRGKAKIIVNSQFDCILSYFKHSDQDSSVLAHEQLHFDITEIYARKFRKAIQEEMTSYKDFLAKHEKIYDKITKEWALKQDEYDSEVYEDRTLQPKWTEWVKTELSNLKVYSNQEIEF